MFARESGATKEREAEGGARPAGGMSAPRAAGAMLRLQRTAGNRAVGRMLSRTTYNPGVNHDHRPSGRWADVQAAPNSG